MSPAVMLLAGPRTSPWRESVRVLCVRLRVMHWVLGFLAVVVFAALALPASRAASPSAGAGQIWIIVAGIGLWMYGMVLALAAGETAQRGYALVPGAGRALWQATATVGTTAAAVVVAGGWLLALLGSTPPPLASALASASMALAGGFGLLFVARERTRLRWAFFAFALLPTSLWRPLVMGESPAMPTSPAWLLLWGLAWPACLALQARSVTAPSPIARSAGALRSRWQAFGHGLTRRGFDCTRADPRWLMRDPAQRVSVNGLLAWLAVLGLLFANHRDLASVLMWVAFIMLFAAAPGLVWLTEGGMRPRLLLLPGGHFRRRLGWTVFREGLRVWSGFACTAFALWAVSALLGHPSAVKGLALGLSFAGLMVLLFGGAIASRAWIAHAGWRAAVQLIAGLALMLLSLAGAVMLDNTAGTNRDLWIALAFAAAALQAALGVGLVAASAKAWAKLDLAQLTRPERVRGPFDPPALTSR